MEFTIHDSQFTNNPPFNEPIKLSLSQLRRDGGTQPRASINHQTVLEYMEDMKNGDTFPPVIVYYDGTNFWLCDGFHRREAAFGAGLTEIAAIVKQGTRRDAVLYSVGANAKHGLRRTNADKRRAVMTLLEDGEWSQLSDREISRQCGVSNRFVSNLRKSICEPYTDTTLNNKRKVIRGGKTYIQDTTNIGKGSSSEPLPPLAEDKEVPTPSEEKELQSSSENKEVTNKSEEKEGISPTSKKENNHPSNTQPDNTTTENAPTDNEPPNIRNLLSLGDRVRIKDNHKFGAQFGIVTFIPNGDCAVVEFSPGFRKVIQLKDFDFSHQPQPQPPQKKEIIIQEGPNYKTGCPGYGCKWYVEVRPEIYEGLREYREKIGTATLDGALARFLEEEKQKTPNSDDLVLYFLANIKQLPRERVNVVLEAFAKAHYKAFVQTFQVISNK